MVFRRRIDDTAGGLGHRFVRKIERYLWREIDCEAHLVAARESMYSQIQEAESLLSVRRETLLNLDTATTTGSVKYAQVCGERFAKIASTYRLNFDVYKSSGFLPRTMSSKHCLTADAPFRHRLSRRKSIGMRGWKSRPSGRIAC
jgi:hypothetical protein